MCGILFTNLETVSEEDFREYLKSMDHRGPDASGVFIDKNIKLGHTRLKIIDLDERSNQPFISRDKRYVMVYNGEIYNFRELKKQYGVETRTESDTEILLELYALYGKKVLHMLNGMFAFVIYDNQTKNIFAARDRLGIKPLYYSTLNGNISIASEIRPIVMLTEATGLDETGIRQYRKLRTFFNSRTLYSSVKMLPAGSYMENEKIVNYWSLPDYDQEPPCDEELRALIETSVKYRCIADVPIGSYLSGGLDSTIVAGLASKPHTWTVGFEDYNEFEWAVPAAEKFNAEHSEVILDKDEFLHLAKELIEKRMEPLSVPNEVLLYKMTKEVKKKNTVILSGEGADELFFGYDRIFRWASEGVWDMNYFSKLYSYGSNLDIEIVEDALSPFLHYSRKIDLVAAFFQIAHLHGLLRRLDNSTMMCSVEARVPFVDHRLVERMWRTPFELRLEKGVVKAQLKRIFRDLVPDKIIKREKVGFPVPLGDIFNRNNNEATPMDSWLDFNLITLGIKI